MTLQILPNPNQLITPPASFSSSWNFQDEVIAGGAGTPYNLNDASVYDEIRSESVRRGPMVPTPLTDPPIEYESLNPAIATVDANGNVESVGTGNTFIICRKNHIKNKVAISAVFEGAVDQTLLVNYLAGTLGKYAYDEADSLLDTNLQTNIFTQHAGTTRNTNVWTGNYDLTGIMQHNTTGGNNGHRGATLISPRHVYMASHFPVGVGATITWVTNDNQIVTRTLTAIADLPNVLVIGNVSGDIYFANTDIRIGLLNSDVPSTITHYKILPVDWREHLTPYTNSEIPIVVGAQRRTVYQRWWREDTSPVKRPGVPAGQEFTSISHILANRASETIIVGDSGQPAFLPVNGELALLGSNFSAGGFSHATTFKAEIDATMTALGGGYQTEDVDLTGFNNYG